MMHARIWKCVPFVSHPLLVCSTDVLLSLSKEETKLTHVLEKSELTALLPNFRVQFLCTVRQQDRITYTDQLLLQMHTRNSSFLL